MPPRIRSIMLLVALLALTLAAHAHPLDGPFLVAPYLQLGSQPSDTSLDLLWEAPPEDADWQVRTRPLDATAWKDPPPPSVQRRDLGHLAPYLAFQAHLTNLPPGQPFEYQVRRDGKPVFSAVAHAPKAADQPCRFVLFGDCAENSPGQRAVAWQAWKRKPDFLVIAGDICYPKGRVEDYRRNFFPNYNSDFASATAGAPLLRSTLFVAAPGNHDVGRVVGKVRNLIASPQALAYYYEWDEPLNGPTVDPKMRLLGSASVLRAFRAAAGPRFPRMANFSFDYGMTHWTVLDSNPDVHWSNPDLRAWIRRDIELARAAKWHFVVFHHPGFSSARVHSDDQQMRVLSDLFAECKVDVVFAGHVHNYQRSRPLLFEPLRRRNGRFRDRLGRVNGRFQIDNSYDGRRHTHPHGVIYVISGAGGAPLYDTILPRLRHWKPKPFTARFVSSEHSLTVADATADRLTVRQIGEEGRELDRFVINR